MKQYTSGIYRIKNIINNKCYYGSSKHIQKRFNEHINKLKNNKHINIILQRA
jgi:predicted GIY-YIG superfamily endonuclease